MRLAFLASNNGSSFRAIVEATDDGRLSSTPVLAVSNKAGAPALEFARAHGIQANVIPTVADPDGADLHLAELLCAARIDLLVLSGYLRKLGPRTLSLLPGRVLNIHPSLLPAFGGAGMYGRRVHDAVLAAGVAETGASVHVVDPEYDQGPVLQQVRIPIQYGDDAARVEARVMAAEPALFIEVLRRIEAGDIVLNSSASARGDTPLEAKGDL